MPAQNIMLKISDENLLQRLMTISGWKRKEILQKASADTGVIARLHLNRCRMTSYNTLEIPAEPKARLDLDQPLNPGQYHQLLRALPDLYATSLRKQFLSVLTSS